MREPLNELPRTVNYAIFVIVHCHDMRRSLEKNHLLVCGGGMLHDKWSTFVRNDMIMRRPHDKQGLGNQSQVPARDSEQLHHLVSTCGRRPVVRGFNDTGFHDVRRDRRRRCYQMLEDGQKRRTLVGHEDRCIDGDDAGNLWMMLCKIQDKRSTHRESSDKYLITLAGQQLIRLFRVTNPVCVASLVDILPSRPVACQTWSLNGEPFRRELLRIVANTPHCPRESLHDETTNTARAFRAERSPFFANVHFLPPFRTCGMHTNSIIGNPGLGAIAWMLRHPGPDATVRLHVFRELSSIPSEEHASRSMAARIPSMARRAPAYAIIAPLSVQYFIC